MASLKKVPFSDSRVFVINDNPRTNYVQMYQQLGISNVDVSDIIYLGALHGKFYNDRVRHQVSERLAEFRAERDVLLISGRAFVNFAVGMHIAQLFPGQELFVAQFDARDEVYKIDRIQIPGTIHAFEDVVLAKGL